MSKFYPVRRHDWKWSDFGTLRWWLDFSNEGLPEWAQINHFDVNTLQKAYDRTGNGYDYSATLVTNQGLWLPRQNKMGVVFDGSNDNMGSASPHGQIGGLSQLTMLLVGKFPWNTVIHGFRSSQGTSRLTISVNVSGSISISGLKSNDLTSFTGFTSAGGTIPDNVACAILIDFNFSGNVCNVFCNMDQIVTAQSLGGASSFSSATPNANNFIARSATSATVYDFELYEDVAWSTTLSTNDKRKAAMSLAMAKWGL